MRRHFSRAWCGWAGVLVIGACGVCFSLAQRVCSEGPRGACPSAIHANRADYLEDQLSPDSHDTARFKRPKTQTALRGGQLHPSARPREVRAVLLLCTPAGSRGNSKSHHRDDRKSKGKQQHLWVYGRHLLHRESVGHQARKQR